MQFNINMFGKPKYEDRVTSSFNENQCERRRFSFLYHNILSCKETSTKRVYNCTSTTKSVWLKAFDMTDYTVKQYLEHCNKKLNKKYVELSKIHCKIDGVDPFAMERATVGTVEMRTITVDKDNFPQYPEYFPEKDSCIWNYEVEGIWSGLVITIVSIVVVILVLGIAIFIYAQKHRSEKRETLNRTVKVNLIDEYVYSGLFHKQPLSYSKGMESE
ncbi:hypothetical protein BLSTO_00989 [Blastocystis sp. subtype 1]